MRVELTYSQVEAVLAAMHGIAEDKRVAFRARLKHFQRLGFPSGVNTGSGRKAVYGVTTLMQMVLALELTQAGMSPVRIVRIVSQNWSAMLPSLLVAISTDNLLKQWDPPILDPNFAWVFAPEALRDLTEEGEADTDYYESVAVVPLVEVPSLIDGAKMSAVVGVPWRTLVLQARTISLLALHHLTRLNPEIDLGDCYLDVDDAVSENTERINKLAKQLTDGFTLFGQEYREASHHRWRSDVVHLRKARNGDDPET